MRSIGMRAWGLGLVLGTIALVGTSVPGSAAAPPDHSGTYGPHWALSVPYGAVSCEYGDDNELDAMAIHQPITLANDRTSGTDRQGVAWRYQVLGQDRTGVAFTSAWSTTKSVSDTLPAHFGERVFARRKSFWNGAVAWLVRYQIRWSRPDGRIVGRTTDHAGQYLVRPNEYSGGCGTQRFGTSAASLVPAGASEALGLTGLWSLLDSEEYPPIFCRFDAQDRLIGADVRLPIVYAHDSGPGVQSQTVGWRFLVDSRTLPGEEAVTIYTSPWNKATASDRRFAELKDLSVTKPASFFTVFEDFYIRYEFGWFNAKGKRVGGDIGYPSFTLNQGRPFNFDDIGCPGVRPA